MIMNLVLDLSIVYKLKICNSLNKNSDSKKQLEEMGKT